MQQRSGNPALKWGAIFGGVTIVLILIDAGIRASSGSVNVGAGSVGVSGAYAGLGCIFFLLYLAAFFAAGIFAARDTGRVGQGSIAGLIAGLITGAVQLVVGLVRVFTASDAILQQASQSMQTQGQSISQSDLRNIVIGATIFGFIIVLLVLVGLGAGLGALGGLVGKNQYRGPVVEYQQSFYQGMPPQGYPQPGYPPQGYPQQPGYPPPPPGYPPAGGAPQYPPQQTPPQYPPQQTPPQYPPQQ